MAKDEILNGRKTVGGDSNEGKMQWKVAVHNEKRPFEEIENLDREIAYEMVTSSDTCMIPSYIRLGDETDIAIHISY